MCIKGVGGVLEEELTRVSDQLFASAPEFGWQGCLALLLLHVLEWRWVAISLVSVGLEGKVHGGRCVMTRA